jgi:hypothetical protein
MHRDPERLTLGALQVSRPTLSSLLNRKAERGITCEPSPLEDAREWISQARSDLALARPNCFSMSMSYARWQLRGCRYWSRYRYAILIPLQG